MYEKFKKVAYSELVPGKIYCDLPDSVSFSTYLKFIKTKDGRAHFEFFHGGEHYGLKEVSFPISDMVTIGEYFYSISDDFLQFLNNIKLAS